MTDKGVFTFRSITFLTSFYLKKFYEYIVFYLTYRYCLLGGTIKGVKVTRDGKTLVT